MRQYVRSTGTDRLNDKFTPFTNGLPKCPDCIFNCLRDPAIPPNNNTSEREIRKWKIKLKNSGCFRYDLNRRDNQGARQLSLQHCPRPFPNSDYIGMSAE